MRKCARASLDGVIGAKMLMVDSVLMSGTNSERRFASQARVGNVGSEIPAVRTMRSERRVRTFGGGNAKAFRNERVLARTKSDQWTKLVLRGLKTMTRGLCAVSVDKSLWCHCAENGADSLLK